MEITLKNLKVAKFMSQETLCYQATIYVDGKKAGSVENEGHGGCSNVHLNPEFRHLNDQKFPLPCCCSEIDMGDKCVICKGTGIWNHRIDEYCDHLADNMEKEKERNKFTKKLIKGGMNFMIVTHGQFIGLKANDETEVRAYMAKKYPKNNIKEIIKVA